jgi:hypothetical protein
MKPIAGLHKHPGSIASWIVPPDGAVGTPEDVHSTLLTLRFNLLLS